MIQEKPFYKETWFIISAPIVICFFVVINSMEDKYIPYENTTTQTRNERERERELEKIKSGPVEYQLAIINKGGPISKNDITVTRFRYLLDSLEKKCINSKQDIADVLVTAQNTLRDNYGIGVGLLSITEGINDRIPDYRVDADCALEAVLYIQHLK
jgi:hypothetical protein